MICQKFYDINDQVCSKSFYRFLMANQVYGAKKNAKTAMMKDKKKF